MKKRTSRRHVLRAAGVALALPWMESLNSGVGHAATPGAIRRFIPVYMPNGASVLWWRTTGTGAGDAWQLSPLLSAFEPLKQKMLLVRQMGNFTWRKDLLTMSPAWTTFRERNDFCGVCRMPAGAFVTPSHSRCPSALLNCIDGDAYRTSKGQNAASSPMNGETVDQLIARTVPKETPLASMQLGLLDGNGALDERHSAMSRNLSWSQSGTALGKDIDPRDVFDALVAAGAGQSSTDPEVVAQAERRRALDLSALDGLTDSTTELQGRLGASDRERLDQFLTGVRELEEKTRAVVDDTPDPACNPVTLPSDLSNADARSRTMNDLIVMALQCDVTRIVTYMLDNSRSDLVYSWVPRRNWENGGATLGGTSTAYHESQHHTGTSADFASITRWHIEVAADLLMKMDAVQEASGGTLLDNSLVMFASDMHHGDHACFDLPLALFGSGSGTFRQNELIALPEEIEDIRQLRDLYFTILNNYFELGVPSFGEDLRGIPNQVIAEILA
jgi:tellurite resistance protein